MAANDLTLVIHDRMPMILDRCDVDARLASEQGADALAHVAGVAARVSEGPEDEPELIEEAASPIDS